jgi:hypothetical protein
MEGRAMSGATRIKEMPLRLANDVHQVVRLRASSSAMRAGVMGRAMAPVGEHSGKPEEVARRIERLYGVRYLKLFARRPREGWTTWGNEIERPAAPPSPGEMPDIPDFLRQPPPQECAP